jgi:hypothetical protein
MKMNKLKRSHDRKVTNLVNNKGNGSLIQNTFGLPAGKNYSCPSDTSICEKVCYAGKLEKLYKAVKANLLHNWELLHNASRIEMYELLSEMVAEFKKDCVKRNAEMLFRIHWDGDFFNEDYTQAWRSVIEEQPDIQFWVYTRVMSAALTLKDIPNLSLYYSTDSDNVDNAKVLSNDHGIKLAYLAKNFETGQADMKALTGRPGAKCPENKKVIPLISQKGSACVTCSLCIYEKSDIVFSATKK